MKIIYKRIDGVNVPYESYETKEEALEALRGVSSLREYSSNMFHSARTGFIYDHGQYGIPNYAPQKYGNSWGIKVFEYYYSGTLNAPKDRRINIRDLVTGE